MMDNYLNVQSYYNKYQYRAKDIVLPRKKYEKRTKQNHIYRNKMENRYFGKEIKDINNLTEMLNQSNNQVNKIGEMLSKINKDIDKNRYKDNISLGIKIPSINRLTKNSNISNFIKVNMNNTNPNINNNINTTITTNNFLNNNIPNNCYKRSRHTSVVNKRTNYILIMPDKNNFHTLKDISSHSKSKRRKYCKKSVILKKTRKNSNIKTNDSKSKISFNKYVGNDEIRKLKIQNYRDKLREDYKATNLISKNHKYNNIKYEYRIINNNENIDSSNDQNSNRTSNIKRESHIMRFIRKHYNLPTQKEKSNKMLNLSLNLRQKSKNKENQNIPNRKYHLIIPTGNEIGSIIPNNKNSSDNRYIKLSSKSIKIPISYSYPINENPQIPKEYMDEIYNHLKKIEFEDLPLKNYMNITQTDINEKMRLILLDWLVEVHIKFNLLTETLFITINLIDKYLSKKNIHRKFLQLLGITALLVACKYEEIYPPEIRELIHMTDNAYNKDQVLQMENEILNIVNFNITFPTSYKFLQIFKDKLNLDDKTFFRCLYFTEVSLINYKSSYFNPSLVAASSLYFNIMNKDRISKLDYDENNLFYITGYNKSNMTECFNCLNNAIKILETIGNKYNSLRRKFKLDRYLNVANKKFYIEENNNDVI